MIKLENCIKWNDNQFTRLKIDFEYYPIKNYYSINIWQLDKCYKLDLDSNNGDIIFNSNECGDLFIQIVSIILKDLDIGKITIEDNKITKIKITTKEFESITAKYEVHLFKQEFYTTKKVFKITQIS